VAITDAAPLILGSASPRRREMVAWIGVPFVVRPAEVDESPRPGEPPGAYIERIVIAKLDAVRAGDVGDSGAILVADTSVVSRRGSLLGKPADDGDALEMIERLSGGTHEVSTRFLLGRPEAGARPAHAETVTTRVTFRAISRREARAYVETGEGRDKAGGYAAQGRAATFVERIEGSYTNVVGLPLCQVIMAMRALGWLAPEVPPVTV
jgi:septum formation protein